MRRRYYAMVLHLLLFVAVGLCEEQNYEETVVWEPDSKHKYVAFREVPKPVSVSVPPEHEVVENPKPKKQDLKIQNQKEPLTEPAAPARVPAPEFSFPVWAADGTICVLVKFHAFFAITYSSQGGYQTVTLKMPEDAKSKGKCASETEDPLIELTWPLFRFTLTFYRVPSANKNDPDTWGVNSIDLLYNTKSNKFPGASYPGKQTARSGDNITLFETPIGKSYFCPTPGIINLYGSKRDKSVTLKLKDVHLQAYEFKGIFGPVHRCSQVRMAGVQDPFPQDETVPVAVGSTLAVLAIAVVVGYAVYRSVLVKRVDYSTME